MKILKIQILILAFLILFLAFARADSGKRWSKGLRPFAALRADWSELSRPAYHDGILYAASLRGEVKALRADTGKVIWHKRIKNKVPHGLAADERGVYFGAEDGIFRSLAASDGAERWQLELRSAIVSAPTIAEGTLYFMAGDDSLYAVDPESGEWKWQFNQGLRKEISVLGLPAPVVVDNIVLVGLSDGILAAFDAKTGNLMWGTRVSEEGLRFEDLDATPAAGGGTIFAASFDGGIAAVSIDGDLLWRVEGGSYHPIALSGNLIIYTDRDGKIRALNNQNGQEIWTAECSSKGAPTGPVSAGDKIIYADSLGHIHILNPESGEETDRLNIWGGIYQTPLVIENRIFAVSGRGIIYALGI